MSKLPNAPLVEVIFELRWAIRPNDPKLFEEDIRKFEYLHGDLYSRLKKEYPYRESLVPVGMPINGVINMPTHRFREAKDNYPLIQVGPGLVTLNTVDSKYFWDDYGLRVSKLLEVFLDLHPFDSGQKIRLILQYVDLIEFDFEKEEVCEFLEKYLNVKINQSFYKQSSKSVDFNLEFVYATELGRLSIRYRKGMNTLKEMSGIIIQTTLNSNEMSPSIKDIKSWLNKSHEFCSDLFKEMTKGHLYSSFK